MSNHDSGVTVLSLTGVCSLDRLKQLVSTDNKAGVWSCWCFEPMFLFFFIHYRVTSSILMQFQKNLMILLQTQTRMKHINVSFVLRCLKWLSLHLNLFKLDFLSLKVIWWISGSTVHRTFSLQLVWKVPLHFTSSALFHLCLWQNLAMQHQVRRKKWRTDGRWTTFAATVEEMAEATEKIQFVLVDLIKASFFLP